MSKPKDLKMGVESSKTPAELQERVKVLRATVEKYLPDFAKMVRENKDVDFITLHQDAFAAGYDDDEYTLFGMALKYAGLHGHKVMIIGLNHETF